jgi:hypothetical protein
MKVSVRVNLSYSYTAEIPDDTDPDDILDVVDTDDPVYTGISRILHLDPAITDYDANTVSVINDETGDYLYEY